MNEQTDADARHEAWKIEHRAWRKYAKLYQENRGHLPLVMHQEVYRHFGNRCQVVEANLFDEVKNAEVTIEGVFGERHTLEFCELELDFVQGIDNEEFVEP